MVRRYLIILTIKWVSSVSLLPSSRNNKTLSTRFMEILSPLITKFTIVLGSSPVTPLITLARYKIKWKQLKYLVASSPATTCCTAIFFFFLGYLSVSPIPQEEKKISVQSRVTKNTCCFLVPITRLYEIWKTILIHVFSDGHH